MIGAFKILGWMLIGTGILWLLHFALFSSYLKRNPDETLNRRINNTNTVELAVVYKMSEELFDQIQESYRERTTVVLPTMMLAAGILLITLKPKAPRVQ